MLRLRRSSTSDRDGELRSPVAGPSAALDELLARGPGGGLEGDPTILMTMGKGGTGKTTVAAALAVGLAARGFSVLTASIDPAHNLGDVLGVTLGPDPAPVAGVQGLVALEVDTSLALERYLRRLEGQLRDAYRYLEVLNLQGYLKTLQYSPGVEEHAVLDEVSRLLEEAGRRRVDAFIVDTPPTGLTVRVLSLPTVSIRWAEQLRKVRQGLLERRSALERALGPQHARVGDAGVELPSRRESDPISRILDEYHASMQALAARMQDSGRAGVILVKNPDRLSELETDRALKALEAFGIPLAMLVINKASEGSGWAAAPAGRDGRGRAPGSPRGVPVRIVPLFSPEPMGPVALRTVAGHILERVS